MFNVDDNNEDTDGLFYVIITVATVFILDLNLEPANPLSCAARARVTIPFY